MARLTCSFISYTLMRTVDITVIIPTVTIPEILSATGGLENAFSNAKGSSDIKETYKPLTYCDKEPYPVLYLLHGMGNHHAAWTSYTNIELYAEEKKITIVMVSAENKSYVNSISGDRFFDFFSIELPDFVKGMFPVSKKSEDTFIAGLSMGGYGALLHALSNPEQYRAIGAFSPAISINPAALCLQPDLPVPESQNLISLLSKSAAKKAKMPSVYISCGEDDFLLKDNLMFTENLRKADIEFTWNQVPGFSHEWRFWDREVENFLAWLPRTDYYSKTGNRQV